MVANVLLLIPNLIDDVDLLEHIVLLGRASRLCAWVLLPFGSSLVAIILK